MRMTISHWQFLGAITISLFSFILITISLFHFILYPLFKNNKRYKKTIGKREQLKNQFINFQEYLPWNFVKKHCMFSNLINNLMVNHIIQLNSTESFIRDFYFWNSNILWTVILWIFNINCYFTLTEICKL